MTTASPEVRPCGVVVVTVAVLLERVMLVTATAVVCASPADPVKVKGTVRLVSVTADWLAPFPARSKVAVDAGEPSVTLSLDAGMARSLQLAAVAQLSE